MRLVDADALKADHLFPTTTTGTKCYRYVSMEQIQNAPTISPELHWIPVTERLPFAEYGESANVLATCRNREQESPDEYRWVRILYFNGGNWCYPTGETYEQQVIAWMALPEPWKGEKDDRLL